MAHSAFMRYSFVMKIVIATPFYPPEKGVLGMYAEGLEGAFRKSGHDVETVVFSAFAYLPPGIRHAVFFFKMLFAARGARFILALDTWSVGQPALYASKILRVPLIVRIGGDFLWEGFAHRTKEPIRLSEVYSHRNTFTLKEKIIAAGIRRLTRSAHKLLFNSRFQFDVWKKEYGFPEERAGILENFTPLRSQTLAQPEGKVFVCAGRVNALKNYDLLGRAFAAAKARHPDIELDTRSLPPAEHRTRVARSYAVIIPSISEANSNSALDAVLAGKPFLMSDDTGTSERLSDCGIFIDTRSEDEIVAGIEKLLDPKEYERLTQSIRAFSFTYSWDDMAKEILDAV